ncbi:antibiotic biosynthesis monooxygenase [Cellulophaga sp. E16_2]|uniref:putative quinol monooxygenase n=1 Tax=Cellulophaga sp. E16_2 TaxID=2789297 RepID=UPI001A927422|nr:putative quinol monooxygenase [Cellulophaga sp. E16_2]MBO0593417.1 antibiotic biosynthesis monooxygenase [Cellulophaga sp. E16_2]
MEIYLSVHIKSKPEHQENVKAILQNLVVQTLKEDGCIRYDLHQGIDDESTFVFYEIWKDQKALDFHNQTSYIKAIGSSLENKLVSEAVLVKTTKL